MSRILAYALALLFALAVKPPAATSAMRGIDQTALKSAEWVNNAVIYSVYLRSFSDEGTFAALEQKIPELKELGVTVIWLMPIHPVGIKNRKGSLGSPYSVRDYYDVNPEFGTFVDFQKLLNTVHKNGMKLIIDLVANHASWDSKLMATHPEWFTHDSTGVIISPNADWTDVADLDYSKAGLRSYMTDMMVWWVREIGIDGFRCDVSEMVPLDFWENARKQLNAIKPVMMLSEGSLPEQHTKAFDITYSWNIYDALAPLLSGKKPADYLDTLLLNEKSIFPKGSLRLRFNTNHDKNAWDSPAILKFGNAGLKLSAVLTTTLPGVPLLYNGEEVANDKKLSLFEKVNIDWSRPRTMDTLYRTLLKLRKDHKALSRGEFGRIPTSNQKDVFTFLRSSGKDYVLVMLNFSDQPREVTCTIPLKAVMKDVFTGEQHAFDPAASANFTIGPKEYRIFVLK
jgi:cyclomaltodextrinase / maltogenic alpha-amylase / neopullulanase